MAEASATGDATARAWRLPALVALAFAPALASLARVWLSVDHYSHGFLIPVVAWVIAQPRLRRLPPAGADPRGLLVLAPAVGLYAWGLLVGSATLQGLSVVGAVSGLVLRAWGGAGLRRLAFPVAFLLFMVPLPPAVLTPLIVQLQLQVSIAAVELLQAAGVSILREGNVMLLPHGQRLFVAEACSGITSIVTLLPLGVVLAWFTETGRVRRIALVAAVVPLAMLGNLIRVVATVAAAEVYGVERVTTGALHDMGGLLTFVLAVALLIGFGALLRLIPAGVGPARPA